MKKERFAQTFRFVGLFLSLIALLFIGKSLWDQKEIFLGINLRILTMVTIEGSLIYLLANFMLVIAWRMLLHWLGETRLSLSDSLRTYGQSQVLKYIPGNIFSLPGRHLLSIQQGMEHGPLIAAATFEIIGLLTTSSIISILGILLSGRIVRHLSLLGAVVILFVALVSPLAIKYVFSREFVLKRLPAFRAVKWGSYSHLLGIWLLYLCFFMLTGFILLWTVRAMQGTWGMVSWSVTFSTFAISWLLGFITPGSPAGVGVREGVIILLLSNYLGGPASLVISLIMRLITMMGDVLFYLCGLSVGRRNSARFHPIQ